MKNIHVLPTDKPSNLAKIKDNLFFTTTKNIPSAIYQNTYITNDEKIKEGDWMIRDNENPIKVTKDFFWDFGIRYFKIILTDNKDLIADGVQAIDDEFLEWFVKNPSCEEVEVISLRKSSGYYDEKEIWHWDFLAYKTIIPKEEPKQFCENCKREISKWGCACGTEKPKQETLEEVIGIKAHEYSMQYAGTDKYTVSMLAIQFGYQLAQQQNKNLYSDEEVIKILIECCGEVSCEDGALVGKSPSELVEWIDTKFKKK